MSPRTIAFAVVTVLSSATLSWANPGPAPSGTAIAEYNVSTGEIIVSVDDVVNWWVHSASSSMAGISSPSFPLPLAGGIQTNNNNEFGETTGFFPMSYTDVSINAAAETYLPLGDLTIAWNLALGDPIEFAPVVYFGLGPASPIPEPTSLMLGTVGVCIVMACRRHKRR